jgi:hypothetical protein
MPALRADVCDGLQAGPPKGSEFVGSNLPLSFKLSVRQGGPAFRITVRPLWQQNAGGVILGDDGHAGDIEVAHCQDGKPLQVLRVTAEQPINFGATFHAEDINFDGYLDFSVLTEFGAKWGSRSYWVYDPASRLFVQNALTRELSENCFAAAHGECYGAYYIDFDPKKREIRTHHFGIGNTGCGAGADRYRVENNSLILVHIEEITKTGTFLPRDCEVTVSDLIGGTMRVTGVRRGGPPSPLEAPPSKPPAAQSPSSREPVSSPSGDLLYERPLDGHQEGLFSNIGERHQVGGGQASFPGAARAATAFVFPDAVNITGVRWYGYYTCKINPVGKSPTFYISFFSDSNGLPASEPIYSDQVLHSDQAQAHVSETTARVPNPGSAVGYKVYVYTADSLPPLSIPAGRRTWISISEASEAPSPCEWLWNRSSSVDTGTSAVRENSRFSKWTQLKADLAFALYGRKIGPVAH